MDTQQLKEAFYKSFAIYSKMFSEGELTFEAKLHILMKHDVISKLRPLLEKFAMMFKTKNSIVESIIEEMIEQNPDLVEKLMLYKIRFAGKIIDNNFKIDKNYLVNVQSKLKKIMGRLYSNKLVFGAERTERIYIKINKLIKQIYDLL